MKKERKKNMKTTKSKSKNKFMRIITIPFRALLKARDLYVRGMTSVERMSLPSKTGRFSDLPKSFSVGPSRTSDNDDYADLVRAASARDYGGKFDLDALLRQQLREELEKTAVATKTAGAKGLPKSSSVGMGKIDEDMPCDFGADGDRKKVDVLYPRSRSYAVSKKSVAF